ncbi:hypothetical protein CHUAL_001608 [Chamberlinius hualienensis]
MACAMYSIRATAILFCCLMILVPNFVFSAPQHFYPNGRYGRRSSMPPFQEISSGREMTVAFFGDGSVSCFHTGILDYYRCGRNSELMTAEDE